MLGEATQLGKYQMLRRIATGGMAEIFLARAQAIHGFEKQVVLKKILPQHASSDDFIRMFLAEARLAATLHHPNIVQVYDIGEDQGAYFFTMEYVQGQDLRALVRAARKKQLPVPLAHILHIIMGLAGGLHHAHEKTGSDGQLLGIVHRDVSPSNVLVTYEGDVKVVDFGIAKAAAAQVSTVAGTLKGKIPYMSPEQCRGEAVDRRSDIFSIGTLLWELTTGKRLFAGENEFAILNRVAKAVVPKPTSIRPEYPPELEAIVMRALAGDVENRYATAIDLQIDLEDFAREARLPVSSARMGRFMRQLFDEEIKAAEVERQGAAAESAEAPKGTLVVSQANVSEGITDLTPSEIRMRAGSTPGIVPDPDPGTGTDVEISEVFGARRRKTRVAMAAGFALTLGLGGLGIALSGDDADADAGATSSMSAVVESSESQAQPASEAEAPDGPGPGDSSVVESPPPVADGAMPSAEPALNVDAGPSVGESPATEDVTKEPKPKPKPKPKTTRRKARDTRSRKSQKTQSPKPTKKKTKKWTKDSARLPDF